MGAEALSLQPNVAEEFDIYRRKYNDAATWLAEVLDGSMRTPFEYQFDGTELYAEDGGALGPIFDDAIEDARRTAVRRPQLSFELRRRQAEKKEYDDMLAMMRGDAPNTMVVLSDFPAELMTATEDVGGYNITRKTAMLRVLTREGDSLKMYSQTLDGSDRGALTDIYRYFNRVPAEGELLGQRIAVDLNQEEQQHITDRLMGIYDQGMQYRYGGNWHAGRREYAQQDTYTFVLNQHELVDYCAQHDLLGLDRRTDLYNVAALITERFESSKNSDGTYVLEPQSIVMNYFDQASLQQQLMGAGNVARSAGKQFNGCGITAAAIEHENQSADEQLEEAGYGNQADKQEADSDDYGPRTFLCKFGHKNRRPRNQLLSHCWMPTCKNSVAC